MKKSIKNFLLSNKKIVMIVIGLILPFIIDILVYGKISLTKGFIIRAGFIYGVYILILIYKLLSKYEKYIIKIADFIMKYRYVIALVVLVGAVLMKINFSSINMWYTYLEETPEKNIIVGEARAIRTDEWITQSSFMLGQASAETHEIHNENISNGSNNMYLISAPVNDVLELVRPLLWGFIFGKEIGFSFYFVLKMIAIIMLSIELVRKITKGNNLLSLVGGIVLALAPAMMWWFSTAVVDGYIYGTLIIVLFGTYMNNLHYSTWKKLLIAFGMVIGVGGFAISLYPAFQVPYAFVILLFVINDFIYNRKNLKKKDYIIMSISIVAILALIARFILISIEDIKLMMGTVYPGERLETGGTLTVDNFIGYLVNIFFPYTDRFGNTCEPSSYIYSFIGLLILIVIFLKNYKRKNADKQDNLIFSLIVLYMIYLAWEFLGFNNFFSKISLLYFSPATRTHIILGIIGTLLTIMLLNNMKGKNIFSKKQGIYISTGVVVFACVLLKKSIYANIITPIFYVICLTMLFAMTYFVIRGKVKQWSFTMLIVAIIAGAYVNPIMVGIKPVTNTNISNKIRTIASEDEEGVWIADGSMTGQYIVANGVKCLNGVNVYPNFTWLNKVDPDKKYNQVYNRFAHIGILLGEETKFQLIAPDSYVAYLTYDNIKDIGVKYYFTKQKVSDGIKQTFNLTEKYVNDERNQYIYEIN